MRGLKGKNVLVTGGARGIGQATAAAYCAAKGSLIIMAKAMAIDHDPQGIRVNCVCPGCVGSNTIQIKSERHV